MLQQFEAYAGITFAEADQHHQERSADNFARQRFADRDGMGAHDISLKLLGVVRADDASRICAKARRHTIDQPVLAQKKIDQAARIQHAFAIDGGELYLCAMSGYGNELLD
ncbi:hypothetical protein PPGU19_034990 [Paraburkholderia sp. PGU19]|nr:hypothetical protein PPGU19_034990 [Paraburkholderia sp. PGU19]